MVAQMEMYLQFILTTPMTWLLNFSIMYYHRKVSSCMIFKTVKVQKCLAAVKML